MPAPIERRASDIIRDIEMSLAELNTRVWRGNSMLTKAYERIAELEALPAVADRLKAAELVCHALADYFSVEHPTPREINRAGVLLQRWQQTLSTSDFRKTPLPDRDAHGLFF